MDRRQFFWHFSFLGVLALKFQKVLASIIPEAFLAALPLSQKEALTIYAGPSRAMRIPLRWKGELAYFSLSGFAQVMQYRTYLNEDKRKVVLYLPANRMVIAANNAYVLIDEQIFQMPAPAIWHQGGVWVPARYFLSLFARKTSLECRYDEANQTVYITQSDVNITDVEITQKANGTVVKIHVTRDFDRNDITADIRYGWLHVDFYGGKADAATIQKAKVAGLVRRVKVFQFPELTSLAFLLRQKPRHIEILPKPDRKEVLVILRTKENVSEEDLAELREEQTHEPSDSIKKQLEEERRKWLIDRVVIDPGHGGRDPGTIGLDKTYEKDIVLAISLKLGEIIRKEMPGVKVIYTRKSDKFLPLRRRTEIANEKNGKVFISIHANWAPKKRISGFETYLLGPEKGEMAREVVLKENSVINFEDESSRQEYQGINRILATLAQNAFMRHSEYLASLVQKNLDRQLHSLGIPNRGVKQAPFWVMVGATMPSILVETGFVSNAYNLKILKTAAYQYKIARGIFEGLKQFKHDYENAI